MSNGLTTTSSTNQRHFSNLETLTFTNILLSTFDFNALVSLKKLSVFDLSSNQHFDNRLETLSKDVLHVLATGGNVWLGENPLSCDCWRSWPPDSAHVSYTLRLLGTSRTVCSAPPAFHGIKVGRPLYVVIMVHTGARDTTKSNKNPVT